MSVIVVIDYHKGNHSSVRRGIMRAGWDDVVISDDPAVIRAAAGLVLPGVGSFYDAIEFMRESGQDEAVLEAIGRGLQLLCERGVEGVPPEADAPVETAGETAPVDVPDALGGPWTPGLGVLAGSVTRL